MSKTIKKLEAKRKKLMVKLVAVNSAIKTLQEVCSHDWEYVGHSHNDKHYHCHKCGAQKDE